MVNSESLSEIVRAVVSEDECLDLVGKDSTLKQHCSTGFSQDTCSSLDKSVQVNAEDICGLNRLCTTTDSKERGNYRDKNKSVSISVRQSDSSSLDLHLSSDSEERAEDSSQDPASTDTNEDYSKDCHLSESYSSSISSEKPIQSKTSSKSCANSPDMFENSQEVFSQDQLFDAVPTVTSLTSSDVLPDGSTESPLSQANNRETEEEWSSQDLVDVSKNLKIRRKQIKRLIAAVIRKRQMEEETLEAFKKRLKWM